MRVAVIGGGSWGTALARVLVNKNYETIMYIRNHQQLEDITKHHENKKYLPGIKLSENLKVTSSETEAIINRDVLLLAIPSHTIRNFLERNKDKIKDNQIIVNVSKGIENDTLMRISEVVKEILPNNRYVVLSGPSHAEEVALDMPTTVVSASADLEAAEKIQDLFMTSQFRVYTNKDVVGVELGGSLKNVIALGAGIADGLGYGDNSNAALMTRGIIEMARLGEKLGADPLTFSGLAGIGDLIVTCTSKHSRNRRAGILIGKGHNIETVVDEVGMVVEGIKTTKSAYHLSKQYNVSMPITEEIYNVIYRDGDVIKAVENLMLREKRYEMENKK